MIVAALVAVSIAAALLLLRGRALQRWLAAELAAWIAFGALAALAKPLAIDVDPYVAFVAFAVLKFAMFFAFVALAPAHDVRWSANRAALVAAMLYALAIPSMTRFPIDGDEPFYLLMTESLVKDHDLNLANQYRDLAHSATGRTDLLPQLGDPVGPHGERYSRHEPFLPLVLIPGYALGRLFGAIAVIALFGALLARSTIRMFEDEGIADTTTRALWSLVAFGPPLLFYATRIWPEVPAAFCFVEAVRGVRQRRAMRFLPALAGLVLFKLRFGLIAIVLLFRAVAAKKRMALGAIALAIPLAIAFAFSGHFLGVHRIGELVPRVPLLWWSYGLFGLMLDGMSGIAFQAPLYLFALVAMTRWRNMPGAFRLGMASATLYILYLIPRVEWHGGWAPPLRYIVVFFPILALGVAALWERIAAGPRLVAIAWTLVVVIHGLAFPWRLFHIENGENWFGEWLSTTWHSDFSRLIPSFIRGPNLAALAGVIVLIAFVALFRTGKTFMPAVAALLAAAFFFIGLQPASRIDFEDAHVVHKGGELYPREYQPLRFLFAGGWIVRANDSLAFRAKQGRSTLRYASAHGCTVQIGNRVYVLPPTGTTYGTAAIDVSRDGRVELRCISGAANLDRMVHD